MNKINMVEQIKKHRTILLLVAILLIQMLSVVYIGANRKGLNIDEQYSYILSNSYDAGRITQATGLWNTWQDGEAFRDLVTVEKGEQFAYKTVYDNNAKDAHPPLFYFMLHTLHSFLPGVWTPWLGMLMNIVLILLTQIVLYKLSRELLGDTLWSVVPVAIYGGMKVFAEMTLFIRMYPLMTLFTVLFAQQQYHLIGREKKLVPIVLSGIITFLGVFTQYYFAIVAFFMTVACCIFFLCQKQWKTLFGYAASMLLGVVLVFVVFPAGITQITGSETNNVGNEVAGNLLNFAGWGRAILVMGYHILNGMLGSLRKSLLITAGLIAVIGVVLVVLRRKKLETAEQEDNRKRIFKLFLVLAVVVGLTVLTIAHVSGSFTYVRYVYNLFPFFALLCTMALWLLADSIRVNKRVLVWGIIAIALVNTVIVGGYQLCTFTYRERAKRDDLIIEQCEDKPVVVLNNGCNRQPTALLHILMSSNQLYMANYENMEPMDTVLEQVDCSNGVVYLVLTDEVWSEGLDGVAVMSEIVGNSQALSRFEEFSKCEFTTVYIAYPEK